MKIRYYAFDDEIGGTILGDYQVISRREFSVYAGGILSLPVALAVFAPCRVDAADLASDAKGFVQAMADDAIVNLTAPDIDRTERKERLHGLMQKYFFVPGIAQWVLGRFWRKATESEQNEFLKLFEGLLVETYVDRFATYNGETLKISKSDVRSEKDVIVSSTLKRPEGNKDIQLDWRVRNLDGSFKVIDIMVEGVSMGQTQRAQFASAIKNNKNDMAKFLTELRDRISVAASDT